MKSAPLRMLLAVMVLAVFDAAQTVMAEVPKIPLKDGIYAPEGAKWNKFLGHPEATIAFHPRSKEIKTDLFMDVSDGYYIDNVRISGNIYHISGECWGGAAQRMSNGNFSWTIKIIDQTSFKTISKTDFSTAGKVYRYWKKSF